jgi:hypothetical protein
MPASSLSMALLTASRLLAEGKQAGGQLLATENKRAMLCPLERGVSGETRGVCAVTRITDRLDFSHPRSVTLNQFHAPQIMQVDDAFDHSIAVNHHQRSDLALFQNRQRFGCQFRGGDGARMGVHGFARSAGEG